MGLTLRMGGFTPSLAHTPAVQWQAESKSAVCHCSVFLLTTSQNCLADCLASLFHVHFSPMSESMQVNPTSLFAPAGETWTYNPLAFGLCF